MRLHAELKKQQVFSCDNIITQEEAGWFKYASGATYWPSKK
jgi:hypothetical protein